MSIDSFSLSWTVFLVLFHYLVSDHHRQFPRINCFILWFQIIIDEDKKFLKLLELLGLYQERGSVLVFVDKQEHADELMKELLTHSYPCMSLHGGIDQYDRDSTILDFKSGNVKLLVRTIYISIDPLLPLHVPTRGHRPVR